MSDSVETGYSWVVAGVSTVMMAVAFGASYLVIVALVPIAADFGWPRSIPSLAYSLVLVGAGAGGILMGYWLDRRGMWQPALLGSVMLGLGTIIAGQATGMWSFLLPHFFIIGLFGNAAMFSPLLTNVTRWFDRRRGLAVAIVAGGQSLAGACWPPLYRYTIENFGWRESMVGYGLFAIAVLVPLSFLLRRPVPVSGSAAADAAAARAFDGRVLGLPANLALALIFMAIIGCCMAMAMPMVHVVAYCSDLGFGAARGAEMLSLLLATAFFSRLGFGLLADRIGGLKTILVGSSLQLVALALYAYVEGMYALYAVSIFFGLGFGGIVPSYALAVREIFPVTQVGWRVGVVYLGGTLGMAAGSSLGGVIFDLTGNYQNAFMAGAAANAINLLLIMFLVSRQGDDDRNLAAAPA